MGSKDQLHGSGSGPDHDFSLVLARTIEAVQNDPAQFRNLIYEMSRVHLQREAWHRNPPMNILELRRMMLALETAIERVETQAAQRDGMPMLSSSGLAVIPDMAPAHDAIVLIDQPHRETRPVMPGNSLRMTRRSAPLRALVRLGVVVALGAAAVIGLDREFHLLSRTLPATVEHVAAPSPPPPTARVAATPAQQPAPPPPVPSVPLPSVYGVYAISGGKLYELEPLVGRAPDLRVFMSAVLKTPSHTALPDGDVSFIAYRRDIASSAPDRVIVRVIAKIARAMTFTKTGQPVTVNVDGEWAIRNVVFDYRVAPSVDSPEMILIKPDTAAPPLAAGRYALVIKGQMFDFTVDGPISQTAQCLERTEAANGTFYSECRQLR